MFGAPTQQFDSHSFWLIYEEVLLLKQLEQYSSQMGFDKTLMRPDGS